MFDIKEMIDDIEEDYVLDVKRIDSRYALSRLWDDFYDVDPDEEMILYNLIIAYLNVKSGEVTYGQEKCIKEALKNYKSSSEEVKASLDDRGNKILIEMLSQIEGSGIYINKLS